MRLAAYGPTERAGRAGETDCGRDRTGVRTSSSGRIPPRAAAGASDVRCRSGCSGRAYSRNADRWVVLKPSYRSREGVAPMARAIVVYFPSSRDIWLTHNSCIGAFIENLWHAASEPSIPCDPQHKSRTSAPTRTTWPRRAGATSRVACKRHKTICTQQPENSNH